MSKEYRLKVTVNRKQLMGKICLSNW